MIRRQQTDADFKLSAERAARSGPRRGAVRFLESVEAVVRGEPGAKINRDPPADWQIEAFERFEAREREYAFKNPVGMIGAPALEVKPWVPPEDLATSSVPFRPKHLR